MTIPNEVTSNRPEDAFFTVKIRRENMRPVRPEAEQLDGKTFKFSYAWTMDGDDPYPGEQAWIPNDPTYSTNAPRWIASGDLDRIQPAQPMVRTIDSILEGIDKDESHIDGGWWPNSHGANFGKEKLSEIKAFFETCTTLPHNKVKDAGESSSNDQRYRSPNSSIRRFDVEFKCEPASNFLVDAKLQTVTIQVAGHYSVVGVTSFLEKGDVVPIGDIYFLGVKGQSQ